MRYCQYLKLILKLINKNKAVHKFVVNIYNYMFLCQTAQLVGFFRSLLYLTFLNGFSYFLTLFNTPQNSTKY